MREQTDLLDHVSDVATQFDRVDPGDVVAVEEDATARRLDEPVDHPQRGGLAASRRADEHADLAVVDVETQFVDGDRAIGIALRDLVEADQ